MLTSPPPALFARDGMDALVGGLLLIDAETGCLLVEHEGVALSVVWPAGTSWQAEPPGVRLADGRLVEPGMSVRGGGGVLQAPGIERMAGATVARAASACAGPGGGIVIFNLGSEVAVVDQ